MFNITETFKNDSPKSRGAKCWQAGRAPGVCP